MAGQEEIIVDPLVSLNQLIANLHQEQIATNELIEKLLSSKTNRKELSLVKGYVIPSGGDYNCQTISNDKYERARVMISLAFNENTTGGASVDLYYSGHRIGEVLSVNSSKAGSNAASEAFDINALNGFTLKVVNHDVTQDAKISQMSIIMYNE